MRNSVLWSLSLIAFYEVNLCRIVPEGLLVFFPSYGVMDDCIRHWQSAIVRSAVDIRKRALTLASPCRPPQPGVKSHWDRMGQHKKLFSEPRGKQNFDAVRSVWVDCY